MDRGVAGRHDHVHLALDQPGGENVDGPGLSLAERRLDSEVPPLDIAKLAQGTAPRLQVRFGELSGASPEHSDAWHFVAGCASTASGAARRPPARAAMNRLRSS